MLGKVRRCWAEVSSPSMSSSFLPLLFSLSSSHGHTGAGADDTAATPGDVPAWLDTRAGSEIA